jgi:hypothetical protein
MNIFGFEIKRKTQTELDSVVSPPIDDGSTLVASQAGYYAQTLNTDTIIQTDTDLIKKYRDIAGFTEVDAAVEDIVNEAIVTDDVDIPVKLNLTDLTLSDNLKKKFRDEFKTVLSLLQFDKKGHDIFRQWYVDGRTYYQILLDENNIKQGIKELRPIDALKIRKVKEVKKDKDRGTGTEIIKKVEEYYVYNDKGVFSASAQGVRLSKDSVVSCTSGIVDLGKNMVLSYLHKAIKPVNQLKMMEDSIVIYRVSRAPERRIFYVDVGNLPKIKAEQYIRDIMNKYRNKLVYDANTGEIKDDRKHMSMLEDFWMPRREGGKGTEITTLPAGQNLGQMDDVNYFKTKLIESLNVPMSRQTNDGGAFNMGKGAEISRDEVKFAKFIGRLRARFSTLFLDILRVQLIIKGIIREDEWAELSKQIKFDFNKDNYYQELKENEIINGRVAMVAQMDMFVGKYYSREYIQSKILRLTEEEIADIQTQIETEKDLDVVAADHQGTISGVTQTAQQNYLQQNAPPETQEAPTAGGTNTQGA